MGIVALVGSVKNPMVVGHERIVGLERKIVPHLGGAEFVGDGQRVGKLGHPASGFGQSRTQNILMRQRGMGE